MCQKALVLSQTQEKEIKKPALNLSKAFNLDMIIDTEMSYLYNLDKHRVRTPTPKKTIIEIEAENEADSPIEILESKINQA